MSFQWDHLLHLITTPSPHTEGYATSLSFMVSRHWEAGFPNHSEQLRAPSQVCLVLGLSDDPPLRSLLISVPRKRKHNREEHFASGTQLWPTAHQGGWGRSGSHMSPALVTVLLLLSRFSRVWFCDPTDSNPPSSPIPGILQARTLEWAAISFSNAWKWKWKWSRSVVSDSATPWAAAHQAPPSMGFPGKSAGVGCHCLLRVTVSSPFCHKVYFCSDVGGTVEFTLKHGAGQEAAHKGLAWPYSVSRAGFHKHSSVWWFTRWLCWSGC